MKMGNSREFSGNIRITADNSTTISENTDDTAVFPMGDLVNIGKFKLSENVPASVVFFCLPLNVCDKTRPGTTFQLIQQGRIMLWHLCFLLNNLLFLNNLKTKVSL